MQNENAKTVSEETAGGESNAMLAQALSYRQAGKSIFPVGRNKMPCVSWKKYQTELASEETIREWWKMYPDANIGMATGKISGVSVVDIDPKNGGTVPQGMPTMTTVVATGGGGWHYYFTHVDGVTNQDSGYVGVDIRGEGGYVVMPPSVHASGKQYEFVVKEPLLPFPVDFFKFKKTKFDASSVVNGVSSGDRNMTAARFCGSLIARFPEKEWESVVFPMLSAWNAKNVPPLKDTELRSVFESISKTHVRNRANAEEREKDEKISIESLDLLYTISKNKDGEEKKTYNNCTENIYRILQNHPKFSGRLRFNNWTYREEIRDDKGWRDLEDEDNITLQRKISELYPQFRSVKKLTVQDAVIGLCRDNSYDIAENYVRSTVWDKTERLSSWLSKTYGVEQNDYHKAVGENFVKGMVSRVIRPGCKFDSVLILEGKQGCGKSTSLGILGGNWHLETTMHADNKDFFMQFRGKLIVEFSEGETLSRTESKKMKAIISTQTDTYRAPYGRTMRDIPRRCVFAMTTNNDEYLKDETGNRRFFPVEVIGEVDTEWLKANRDQIFAEALYRVEIEKESMHEYPKESADVIRSNKMVQSGLESMIEKWIENPCGVNGTRIDIETEGIEVSDIWLFALNGTKDRFSKWDEMRVAQALRNLNFEKLRQMKGFVRAMRWFPKK